MSWQPAQEGLNEVLKMLRDSMSADTATQRAVTTVRSLPAAVHRIIC